MSEEHFLERDERAVEILEDGLLLLAPEVETTAAEFAFLVADEAGDVGFGDELAPMDIIESEGAAFDLVFDELPEDELDAFQFMGEQAELKFIVEVLGDHLGILADLEDDVAAVFEDRDVVIASAGQSPNGGPIGIGDVDGFELCTGVLEDASSNDAKWAPGELIEFDHEADEKRGWAAIAGIPGCDRMRSGTAAL
jgi:hypothetical protein